ncbi:virulence factor BrkB family protein [Colwellia echini]|nr:virulence factor BrkB family protein [Colwellia echini]
MSLFAGTVINKLWDEHKGQLFYFIRRVIREDIQVVAGYLSYVCLMSLVPLIVVTFSVLTAFPLFAEVQQTLEQFVYQNFVPAAGDVLQKYLTGFVANASKMSAVAISFLFIAALLLISTIDNTFNKIWRVTTKRRTMTSFAMYWMVLTLGPILVGASIALSTYLVSIVSDSEYGTFGLLDVFLRILPLFSAITAFVILYMAVPNKRVPFKFAISGAIVAGVLFELAKKLFSLYLTAFPSYQVIYGALAAIPIVFLWVYLSWMIVLIGALVTVSRQEYCLLQQNALKDARAVARENKKIVKQLNSAASDSLVDDTVIEKKKSK